MQTLRPGTLLKRDSNIFVKHHRVTVSAVTHIAPFHSWKLKPLVNFEVTSFSTRTGKPIFLSFHHKKMEALLLPPFLNSIKWNSFI